MNKLHRFLDSLENFETPPHEMDEDLTEYEIEGLLDTEPLDERADVTVLSRLQDLTPKWDKAVAHAHTVIAQMKPSARRRALAQTFHDMLGLMIDDARDMQARLRGMM